MSITITSVPTTIATNGFNELLQADDAGHISANVIAATSIGTSVALGIVGYTTSSNVPVASAVALTTNTVTDITSLALSAGNWLVYGNVVFNYPTDGSTITTQSLGWISTASATFPTPPNGGSFFQWNADSTGTGGGQDFPVGNKVVNLSSSGHVYLSTYTVFTYSEAPLAAYGFLGAIRLP